VTRRRFREVVTGALGPRAMSPANVNFLFDIFDACVLVVSLLLGNGFVHARGFACL
jgi:hypothetical protein